MTDKLLQRLKAGCVCVTATERLAGAMRREYGKWMVSSGAHIWPAPEVVSWKAWVRGLWENLWQPESIAPALAESVLWEEAVAADAERHGMALLDVTATAAKAAEAESLIALYLVQIDAAFEEDEECRAFLRWRETYSTGMTSRSWIAAARLEGEISRLADKGRIPAREAVLFGFDEPPPPARRKLIEALEGCGWRIEEIKQEPRPAKVGRAEFPDTESEVRHAALWAGAVLSGKPDSSVGIVSVRAEETRAFVERIFPAQLTPLATIKGDGLDHPPYDLSLGGPLADEPLVQTALLLLSCWDGDRTMQEWRSLLTSRFWDFGTDVVTGAALARHVAKIGRTRFNLEELAGQLERGYPAKAAGAPEVAGKLRLLASVGGGVRNASPSAWALKFTTVLDVAAWSRTVMLSSREFQCVEKFGEALSAMSQLDAVVPSCNHERALSLLRSVAATPFRPKVGDTPIHVLGLLEATGLVFDYLWVIGASDRNLPPQSRANPFIPFSTQVRAGIRQSLPDEALLRATAIVDRLKSSAGEVIFSSALEAEGASCGPSPLTAAITLAEPCYMDDLSLSAQVARGGVSRLQRGIDVSSPIAEGELIRGGSRLFAWQAQCPFRAFVGLRLGVEEELEAQEGLDRGAQGTMLHLALKTLHATFPDHRTLLASSHEEREEALERAVSEGLSGAGETAGAGMLEVEAVRMRETLRGWLEAELERPDYVVLEREAARRLIIGSIPVKLQLDRLDRTDGGDLVIDYKTTASVPTTSSLTAERLTEPQLPLYALACEDAKGVAYAVMERGGCRLYGIGESAAGPGITPRPDWEELKSIWRSRLLELANEFENGRADPDPGGKREHCKYCGLDPVCRTSRDADGGEE